MPGVVIAQIFRRPNPESDQLIQLTAKLKCLENAGLEYNAAVIEGNVRQRCDIRWRMFNNK
jgi:hypothetical protein